MVAFQHDLRRTLTDRGEIVFLTNFFEAFFGVLLLAVAITAFAASKFCFMKLESPYLMLDFLYFLGACALGASSFTVFVHVAQSV